MTNSTPLSLKDKDGLFFIPMILLLLCLTTFGLGVWGFLRNWRHLAETQLRLDRCVASVSHELKRRQTELDRGNRRIRTLRAAIVAAALSQPETVPGLRAALTALARLQDISLMTWKARQIGWIAHRGCGEGGDLAMPLPSLGRIRDAPDWIGEKELRSTAIEFRITADHPPRHSSARIFQEANSNVWREKWAKPRNSVLSRAGIH